MNTGIAISISAAHRLPAWALGFSLAAHVAVLFGPVLQRQAMRSDLPPLAVSFRLPAVLAPLPAEPARVAARFAPPASPAVTRAPLPGSAVPSVARADKAPAAALPAISPETLAVFPAPPAAVSPVLASERDAVPPAAPEEETGAPAAVADAAAIARYTRLLGDLLARQRQYPRLAAARGWEGEVLLRLRVARKGAIVAVHIVHSSGFDVLDQHAVQLVHSTPLPPPPGNGASPDFQIDVPIHYALKRS